MSLSNLSGLEKYIPRVQMSLTLSIAVFTALVLPALLFYSYMWLEIQSRQVDPKGCRKIGLHVQSNLADEQDKRYTTGPDNQSFKGAIWKVKSLWIYPVKSCKGVELDRGSVIGAGMEYDRQFSFARYIAKSQTALERSQSKEVEHGWKFLTQRQTPKLATIKSEVWVPDPASPTYTKGHPNVLSGGVVVIKFSITNNSGSLLGKAISKLTMSSPKIERSVHIPFNPTPEQIEQHGYATEDFEIWKDKPGGLVMASTEGPKSWIHELQALLELDKPFALFRVSTEQPREVYRNAPTKECLGWQPQVGFQDAYPLHMMNLASVHDVGGRLQVGAPPLSAKNFRPNIIITGGEAYAEDSWKRITIGEHEYYVACRTGRCLLPNVDQGTGVKHGSEPNKTLKSFRRVDEGDPTTAQLGVQMVPAAKDSNVISVGDTIAVLETGEHFYIKQ